MARQQDSAPRATRLSGILPVALLSAATSLAFGRVFVGRAPTLKLIVAGLASVGVAALLERRSLLLATLLSAIALLWAIGIVVFPKTLWYGLPSPDTLSAIGRALGRVGEQARVQVAPTPPLAPLFLAALTAVWTASFSAHALAVRAGSPLLAILPPVALVGFADTVLEDGARPVYAIVFLASALAVVFVDGLRRIRQWGPMWAVHRRARHATATMTRGARSVALIAVGTAVLVPWLLPGFRSNALIDFSTSPDQGVHIDPFVSIRAQLERNDPVDLFQVTSSNGRDYWRLYALDLFDGTRWSSSDPTLRGAPDFPTPAQLPAQAQIPEDTPVLQQHYRILTDLHDDILPMAYPPTSVTLSGGGPVRYDPDLSKAGIDGELNADYEYTVSSRIVSPTPEQLDAVTFQQPSTYGKYTYVPPNVSPRVKAIAEQWAGSGTPYRQVLAIMDRFRRPPFRYSLDVDVSSSSDALLDFLTRTHRGFCQQFATAMAVMVRELGLPARVAVGFQPGDQHGDTYTVSTDDAHSWVEVLFPGYGWLAFEPTPGRTSPIALPGSYLQPSTPSGDSTGGGQGEDANGAGGGRGAACLGSNGRPLPGQLCNADPAILNRGGRGGRGDFAGVPTGPIQIPDTGGYHVPYRWILLGVLAALLALGVLVPTAKALWRRRAVAKAKGPRALVLAAFRVFDGEAADVGLGRADGETLDEYRRRLVDTVSFSDGHLEALTAATIRAAYSPADPDPAEAERATRAARIAIKDVRRRVGVLRRITGTYRPGW